MDSRDLRRRTPTRRIGDALSAVRRVILRRRRLVAAVSIGVALAATVSALSPPPAPSVALQVAAHDLPAGHTLTARDLIDVRVPPGVVPEGVVERTEGRMLAAALRQGEPVTDVRLLGAGITAMTPAGRVVVPVRISDSAQAALLSPGEVIDLFATDPQTGTTTRLAERVRVLAVPVLDGTADGALPGRIVVVGLDDSDVEDVTSASVTSYVTYTWSRG